MSKLAETIVDLTQKGIRIVFLESIMQDVLMLEIKLTRGPTTCLKVFTVELIKSMGDDGLAIILRKMNEILNELKV